MLKETIEQQLKKALEEASPQLNNLALGPEVLDSIRVERPRHREHGDYAVNVSSLAKWTKMAPPKIAETLQQELVKASLNTNVIGGFINFNVDQHLLAQSLIDIVQTEAPAKNKAFSD